MTDQFRPDVNQGNENEVNQSEINGNQFQGNRTDLPHDEAAAPIMAEDSVEPEAAEPILGENDSVTNVDEETATEVSPAINNRDREIENVRTMEEEEAGGTALGWTALVLSILALFFLPVLLGSVGAITGFFAYRNGARTLGMWSIAIGLFAIVMGAFFIPFIVR